MLIENFMKKKSSQFLYEDYYKKNKNQIIDIMKTIKKNDGKIAVWGMGLKGIALLKIVENEGIFIDELVDINPKLIGKKIKKIKKIIDYKKIIDKGITHIFIVNGVFYNENREYLEKINYNGEIYDLDDIIYNGITIEELIKYGYKRRGLINIEYNKIQKKLLDIILLVDKICKKNKITYFLEGGSALGAVRHNGFIPWDDDADIGMLRGDYNKFKKIIKNELPEGYFYQTINNKSDYYYPYDQIGIINSAYATEKNFHLNIYHGIHIDIFPYDYFSDKKRDDYNKWIKLRKLQDKLYHKKYKCEFKSSNIIKQYIVNRKYYNMKLCSYYSIYNKLNKLMVRNNVGEDDEIGYWFAANGKFRSYKYNDIFPIVNHDFEGHSLPIPKNSDNYLKKIYGDYMSYPPVSVRGGRNMMVELSFDKRIKHEKTI